MFEKMFDEIKEWKGYKFNTREYTARVKVLPKNYQIVYEGIIEYIWSFGVTALRHNKARFYLRRVLLFQPF